MWKRSRWNFSQDGDTYKSLISLIRLTTFLSCHFSCSSLLHSASCLQTLVITYLSLKYLFWNQPASSKGSREGHRHPEADRHKHSQHDPISSQKTTLKNTHWKCMTDNITDLMVNMKFMVLPSLQWPVQICVTLNGIILQDIAPWHGKANNVYYSGYTHTEQCKQLVLITQLQDGWEARLEMTCRIQKNQCSFKRRRVCYEPGKKFGSELPWKFFRSRKIQGEYSYQAEPVDCLISICKLCCTEFLLIH